MSHLRRDAFHHHGQPDTPCDTLRGGLVDRQLARRYRQTGCAQDRMAAILRNHARPSRHLRGPIKAKRRRFLRLHRTPVGRAKFRQSAQHPQRPVRFIESSDALRGKAFQRAGRRCRPGDAHRLGTTPPEIRENGGDFLLPYRQPADDQHQRLNVRL